MGGDRGDIVLGWLTKLIVALALVGVIIFDFTAIALANLKAADDSASAARIGMQDFLTNQDADHACLAAAGYATEKGLELSADTDCTVDLTTGAVTVTLRKEAETFVLKHLGFMKDTLNVSKSATVERPK